MIARDAGCTRKAGLEVSAKGGQRIGCVDQESDAQGWMQVEALGLGLRQAPFSPSLVIGRLNR